VPAARPGTRHFCAEHVAGKARSGGAPWRQPPPETAGAPGPGAKTAGGGVVRNALIAVLAWLAIWNCRVLASSPSPSVRQGLGAGTATHDAGSLLQGSPCFLGQPWLLTKPINQKYHKLGGSPQSKAPSGSARFVCESLCGLGRGARKRHKARRGSAGALLNIRPPPPTYYDCHRAPALWPLL
jgi:hypothetical protein